MNDEYLVSLSVILVEHVCFCGRLATKPIRWIFVRCQIIMEQRSHLDVSAEIQAFSSGIQVLPHFGTVSTSL